MNIYWQIPKLVVNITEFRNEVHEAVPSMGIVYGKAEAFLKLNTH